MAIRDTGAVSFLSPTIASRQIINPPISDKARANDVVQVGVGLLLHGSVHERMM